MKRKKFIKMLMSEGVGRNVANWAARERSEAAMRLLALFCGTPGLRSITGVAQSKDGLVFRVKREVEKHGKENCPA